MIPCRELIAPIVLSVPDPLRLSAIAVFEGRFVVNVTSTWGRQLPFRPEHAFVSRPEEGLKRASKWQCEWE